MKLEEIGKGDTVSINRDGGPKIGTVISINQSRKTVFVSYRKATFDTLRECRGYFKPGEIESILIKRSPLPDDAPRGQASKRDPLGDVFFDDKS